MYGNKSWKNVILFVNSKIMCCSLKKLISFLFLMKIINVPVLQASYVQFNLWIESKHAYTVDCAH